MYADGDVYEGEFLNDKRHGFGVLVRANQDRFEGNWADDMKEGPVGFATHVARSVSNGMVKTCIELAGADPCCRVYTTTWQSARFTAASGASTLPNAASWKTSSLSLTLRRPPPRPRALP
eukprot:SAG11_NODE_91_length_17102_cov_37.671343_16_plen_120_part_00